MELPYHVRKIKYIHEQITPILKKELKEHKEYWNLKSHDKEWNKLVDKLRNKFAIEFWLLNL